MSRVQRGLLALTGLLVTLVFMVSPAVATTKKTTPVRTTRKVVVATKKKIVYQRVTRRRVTSLRYYRHDQSSHGATAVCADGSYDYKAKSKTTCSKHHGVAWWF